MLKKPVTHLLRAMLFAFVLWDCASGQTEKKRAYVVLLHNTGSMTTQFQQVVMLGKAIVKRVSPHGPVLLATFRTNDPIATVTPASGWTQDEAALNSYIDGLRIVGGQTMLFETVQSMAEELDAKANSDTSIEKIIILITDGDDRIRRHKGMVTGPVYEDDERKRVRNQLIKKLKGSGIKVYAVGLTRELDGSSVIQFSRRDKAENHLSGIAKETGGRAVFPQSKKIDVDKLLDKLLAQ